MRECLLQPGGALVGVSSCLLQETVSPAQTSGCPPHVAPVSQAAWPLGKGLGAGSRPEQPQLAISAPHESGLLVSTPVGWSHDLERQS